MWCIYWRTSLNLRILVGSGKRIIFTLAHWKDYIVFGWKEYIIYCHEVPQSPSRVGILFFMENWCWLDLGRNYNHWTLLYVTTMVETVNTTLASFWSDLSWCSSWSFQEPNGVWLEDILGTVIFVRVLFAPKKFSLSLLLSVINIILLTDCTFRSPYILSSSSLSWF